MALTPLARWNNFNLTNLQTLLRLYPKWSGTISQTTLVNFLNSRLPAYGRTAYQSAGQLGLENREDPTDIKINTYLNSENVNQLNNYLIFWLKTYYVPNPYVKTGNTTYTPFNIYTQLAEDILSSPSLRVVYNDFLITHDIFSGSNDILKNALVEYGNPLKYDNTTGEFYILDTDEERLRHEMDVINTRFPIPASPSNRTVFFNRYREENFNLFIQLFLKKVIDKPYNRLLNGAPGTGKSHLLNEDCVKYLGTNYEEYMERVTFHLTYSYQQFVGTYKPVPIAGSITYSYVPGPLLRLLVRAIKDYEANQESSSNYILIIEELNRAKNPDAVFGDIFQLLDRNSIGFSKYTITCSEELLTYLTSEGLGHLTSLYLPPNFYIWATMNNADQGVQSIDSAFFRRWKPKYIDINNGEAVINTVEVNIKGYGNSNWNSFRKELNRRLLELGIKEDKLIGTFFIDRDSLNDDFQEVFVNKLLRYLFEDVMKFDRASLFGSSKHFYEVTDHYSAHDIVLLDLDDSTFKV